MAITKVYLTQYSASVDDSPVLLLGTKDSYGNEQLQIIRSPEWEDLIITATFAAGDTPLVSPVLVPEDGLIDVPAGATAERLPLEACGVITFCGVADGVQRISTSLPYLVSDHGPIEGTVPAPTPSEWEQFVAQVKSDADRAKQGAADAEDAASDAKKALESTGAAVEDAKNAAAAAAQSAKEAAAESGKVQEAAKSAVSDIDAAKKAALTDIDSAKNSAVSEVNDAGAAQTKAVQDEGTEQVQAVTEAGDTQAQRLKDLVPEVYTKAESDARYAPIEATIKVSGKGTGLVSLSPTVGWKPQGLKLYGRSWQNGMPSVEQKVPIESAGQSGNVDVTVCGANLLSNNTDWTTIPSQTGQVVDNNPQTVGALFPVSGLSSLYLSGDFSLLTNATARIGIFEKRPTVGDFCAKRVVLTASGKIDVSGYSWILVSLQYNFVPNSSAEKIMSSFMLNVGDTAQPYQPYTAQQLHIPTTDGLPGIPADSGGNWTDENGQQWVSDVVDLRSGTKIQYLARYKAEELTLIKDFYTSSGIYIHRFSTPVNSLWKNFAKGMCNIFTWTKYGAVANANFITDESKIRIYLDESVETVDQAKQFLEENNAEFLIQLSTPITTPLDDATIAAYKALQSYHGTTNIIAPDCGIEATAVGDATQIIANITQKVAALESAATGI